MTLAEQHAAMSDTEWIGKVTQALVKAAVAIMNEPSNQPNHELRVPYANAVLAAPDAAGVAMTRAVSTDDNIVTVASATDVMIQSAVTARLDAFAGAHN